MIPQKREELLEQGYVFDNEAHCRGCGQAIEWWITPKGRKLPMALKEVRRDPKNAVSPVVGYLRIPHFVDCPNVQDFRK